ncbi:MAG TPA: hypothetical protein VM536_08725 [Chloroflexia bacterium]|nr:hypothetical protein [Chloroflexia bacterium]
MTKRTLGLLLLLASLTALPGTPMPAAAQPVPADRLVNRVPDPHQAGVQWFPATGHTLRGQFLAYWTRYGGLAQFGYPITEEFFEPSNADGRSLLVQYFERNRFELHPENAGTLYQVLLGTLGSAAHAPEPRAAAQPAPARYYAATGHNLSGAFAAYWDGHGGLFVHGYPISEPFTQVSTTDGKPYTVQYFERSRFELHPENAGTPFNVLLGLLGSNLAGNLGFFAGAYPPNGHATDFSWVAGYFTAPRRCSQPDCACTFQSDANVQPVGPTWDTLSQRPALRPPSEVVAFGHLAGPNDPRPLCPKPGYIVDRAQPNMVP